MPKGEGKLIAQTAKLDMIIQLSIRLKLGLFYKEQKSNLFEMVVSI